MTYLGMQIMVEGLALAAFGFMHQMTTEPLLKQLLRYVMSDEARHVAFGVLSLQEYYTELTDAEIRERAGVRVRGRGAHARPVPPAGGLGAHGRRRQGRARSSSWPTTAAQMFQTMLFSKIVPNCKKLGLLDRRRLAARALHRARRDPVRGLGRHRRGVRDARRGRQGPRGRRRRLIRRSEYSAHRASAALRGGRAASPVGLLRGVFYRPVGRALDPGRTGRVCVTATRNPARTPRPGGDRPRDRSTSASTGVPRSRSSLCTSSRCSRSGPGSRATARARSSWSTYLGRMFLIDRGLSPVLLAPQLPDGARPAVRDGVRLHDGRAEGAAVVGRPSPRRTTATPTPRTTSTRRCAASGGVTSAGSCATSTAATQYDEIKDFAKYPELRFLEQVRLDRAVVARCRVLLDRRMERARRRVLRVDDPVVAHDVLRELARARLRPARLRDGRHEPELDVHRARSPAARAGTTTTTATRRRRGRASAGGRSTRPTTG